MITRLLTKRNGRFSVDEASFSAIKDFDLKKLSVLESFGFCLVLTIIYQ